MRVKCFFCNKYTSSMKYHKKKCKDFRQLSKDVFLYEILPRFMTEKKKKDMLKNLSNLTKWSVIKQGFKIIILKSDANTNKKKLNLIEDHFKKIRRPKVNYNKIYLENGNGCVKNLIYYDIENLYFIEYICNESQYAKYNVYHLILKKNQYYSGGPNNIVDVYGRIYFNKIVKIINSIYEKK